MSVFCYDTEMHMPIQIIRSPVITMFKVMNGYAINEYAVECCCIFARCLPFKALIIASFSARFSGGSGVQPLWYLPCYNISPLKFVMRQGFKGKLRILISRQTVLLSLRTCLAVRSKWTSSWFVTEDIGLCQRRLTLRTVAPPIDSFVTSREGTRYPRTPSFIEAVGIVVSAHMLSCSK